MIILHVLDQVLDQALDLPRQLHVTRYDSLLSKFSAVFGSEEKLFAGTSVSPGITEDAGVGIKGAPNAALINPKMRTRTHI